MYYLHLGYIFLLLQIIGGSTPEAERSDNNQERRDVVPVVFVRGTHYDVGFDVGRTFGSLIRNFIRINTRLPTFEKEYKTENGKQAYERTLINMKKRYPFYVKEIQGVADGAEVPFYELFLLHMDDIIETINENHVTRNDTGGCSSIAINLPDAGIIGHTEDAFAETLNHFYIISAHVIPSPEDAERGAVEERFASLCYAGELPGYTSGYNEHGLIFSINTLSPKFLKPGATPRTFLTRALLAAQNVYEVKKILRDDGLGAANGFSLNMLWSDWSGKRELYNVEVGPDLKADHSMLNIKKYDDGDTLMHCNKYQRLKLAEVKGSIIESSISRQAALHAHPAPRNRCDVTNMISDITGKEFKVFQTRDDAVVKTICASIFDLDERTWNIYIQKPNESDPVAVLPIRFSMLQETGVQINE